MADGGTSSGWDGDDGWERPSTGTDDFGLLENLWLGAADGGGLTTLGAVLP